jgi:hypothetical protein
LDGATIVTFFVADTPQIIRGFDPYRMGGKMNAKKLPHPLSFVNKRISQFWRPDA